MTRRPSEPRAGDLFGEAARPARDRTPVRIPLQLFGETDKAWLLRLAGSAQEAKWAPKSQVARGVGVEINTFIMPRWLARERGWL